MGQVGLGQGGLLNGWDRWDWDRGFFRLGGTGWDRDRGVFRLGGPEGTGTFFFGLLCRHTASNSITAETHTSGAQ